MPLLNSDKSDLIFLLNRIYVSNLHKEWQSCHIEVESQNVGKKYTLLPQMEKRPSNNNKKGS